MSVRHHAMTTRNPSSGCNYTCGGVECCWRHYPGAYFSGPTDAQCDAAYSSHEVCTNLHSSQRHLPQIELLKNGATGGITLDECRTAAFNAAPIVDAVRFMPYGTRCFLQNSYGYSEVEAELVEDASTRRANIAARLNIMGAEFTLGSTTSLNHYGTHTTRNHLRSWYGSWNENWMTADVDYEAWMVLSISPPSPPPTAPDMWITDNAAFGGCDDVTFGNGTGNNRTQSCIVSSTGTPFTYWNDRSELHNVNDANPDSASLAYWPSLYNEFPGGMAPYGRSNSSSWVYTRPTMSPGGNPCSNGGGFEGSLTNAAFAIMGVYTGYNVDSAPRDYDLNGKRQLMYRRILNDATYGGVEQTLGGESVAFDDPCFACAFTVDDSTGTNSQIGQIVYYRMYLTPGYHTICSGGSWSTGLFLRALKEHEKEELNLVATEPVTFCPYGWSPHDGACYKISNISGTRDSMATSCAPGVLASILDATANDFVLTMVAESGTADYYLGGRKHGIYTDGDTTSANWEWDDGQTWEFTGFGTDEPNNMVDQPCLTLRYQIGDTKHGTWLDHTCADYRHGICKFYSPPPSPPPPAFPPPFYDENHGSIVSMLHGNKTINVTMQQTGTYTMCVERFNGVIEHHLHVVATVSPLNLTVIESANVIAGIV
jgi:hypothetical protein